MKTETMNIEDAVVIAYGVRKKGTVAGSVSTVKSEKLENTPTAAFDQALQKSSKKVFRRMKTASARMFLHSDISAQSFLKGTQRSKNTLRYTIPIFRDRLTYVSFCGAVKCFTLCTTSRKQFMLCWG